MSNKQSFAKTATLGVTGKKHQGLEMSDVIFEHPGSLFPNPQNTKLFGNNEGKYAELLEDIRERGIIVPLIVKPDKTLLAGHSRLRVALELGLDNIPVQYVENTLTEQQEREFLIKDNLFRRQLTSAEWIDLYRILFPNFDERVQEKVSGRKSQEEIRKNWINGTAVGIPQDGGIEEAPKKPLTAREIAKATGQKERTVQHQLKKHREEKSGKATAPKKSVPLPNREVNKRFSAAFAEMNQLIEDKDFSMWTAADLLAMKLREGAKKHFGRTEVSNTTSGEQSVEKRFDAAREEILLVIEQEDFTLWHPTDALGRTLVKKAAEYFASKSKPHDGYNTFTVMEDVNFGFRRVYNALRDVGHESFTSEEREKVYAFVQSKINDLQERLNVLQEEV